MHDVSHPSASLVLLATLAIAACGSESPSAPQPPYIRGTETLTGPPIPARSSFCQGFNNAKAGPVSADVSPRSIHLVVGAGTCSAPGQTLAEDDGEVANVEAPAGPNHVTMSNRADVDTAFTLRITHWY
jgi:hypothetical protein